MAEWILGDLRSRGIDPNVVHAHKFTIEGLVALRLGEPGLSGDLQHPGKHGHLYRHQTHRCPAGIPGTRCGLRANPLSFAPWSGPAMQRILGTPLSYEVLPVGTTCDRLLAPTVSDEVRLVSLFHLDSWRDKGADTLAAAAAAVADHRPGLILDIWRRFGKAAQGAD